MKADTNISRKYAWYKCGRCNHDIYYLKSETRPNPCTECGWEHETKRIYEIPSVVRLDLAKPSQNPSGY